MAGMHELTALISCDECREPVRLFAISWQGPGSRGGYYVFHTGDLDLSADPDAGGQSAVVVLSCGCARYNGTALIFAQGDDGEMRMQSEPVEVHDTPKRRS